MVASGLITIGVLLATGLLAEMVARRLRYVPRVTLLMLVGLAAGPVVFDVLPPETGTWFPVVTNVSLAMIGFLLGGEFTLRHLREQGSAVFTVSLFQAGVACALVAAGLALLSGELALGLSLGGIAAATAPAATVAVVQDSGRRDRFSRALLGVVALDDVWGILLFSVLTAVAGLTLGNGALDSLAEGVWEITGGVALGALLGLPVAFLTGRLRPGEPTLLEALGAVLLCAGLGLALGVSFLIAAVTMGVMVANLAAHHTRPFHEIEGIEWPFLVVFFVLAGASLEVDALEAVSLLAVGYIVLRTLGKILGSWIGGVLAGLPTLERRWLGFGMLPQAGVALGLALLVEERFPEVGEEVLPIVVVSTVVFELVGPVLTRMAAQRVPENHQARKGGDKQRRGST